jgi:hypothetical protein
MSCLCQWTAPMINYTSCSVVRVCDCAAIVLHKMVWMGEKVRIALSCCERQCYLGVHFDNAAPLCQQRATSFFISSSLSASRAPYYLLWTLFLLAGRGETFSCRFVFISLAGQADESADATPVTRTTLQLRLDSSNAPSRSRIDESPS